MLPNKTEMYQLLYILVYHDKTSVTSTDKLLYLNILSNTNPYMHRSEVQHNEELFDRMASSSSSSANTAPVVDVDTNNNDDDDDDDRFSDWCG